MTTQPPDPQGPGFYTPMDIAPGEDASQIQVPTPTRPSEQSELEEEYKSSGLLQIAFNSNGHDFYPETIKELLEWRDIATQEAVVEGRFKELQLAVKAGAVSDRYAAQRVALIGYLPKEVKS